MLSAYRGAVDTVGAVAAASSRVCIMLTTTIRFGSSGGSLADATQRDGTSRRYQASTPSMLGTGDHVDARPLGGGTLEQHE